MWSSERNVGPRIPRGIAAQERDLHSDQSPFFIIQGKRAYAQGSPEDAYGYGLTVFPAFFLYYLIKPFDSIGRIGPDNLRCPGFVAGLHPFSMIFGIPQRNIT